MILYQRLSKNIANIVLTYVIFLLTDGSSLGGSSLGQTRLPLLRVPELKS